MASILTPSRHTPIAIPNRPHDRSLTLVPIIPTPLRSHKAYTAISIFSRDNIPGKHVHVLIIIINIHETVVHIIL